MSSVRIPLAFYTADRGYSWHCTNAMFSSSDFAAIENRVLSCSADNPIARVFTNGDRVFFARHLNAENYDSNMRSADYYVVGAVRKYEARNVDFKKVFEDGVFASPINREAALAGKFPSYLDYDGGAAANGKQPSGDSPGQLGAEVLSSIGNWIGNEDGDVVVNISNGIANPLVDVKIEGGRHAGEDAIERKVLDESGGSSGPGPGFAEQLKRQEKHGKEVGCGDCPKDSETFFAKAFDWLRGVFGLRSSGKNVYGMGSGEIHDYRNLGTTQADRQSRRCMCPKCNGRGWVYLDSPSQSKGS